MDFEQLVKEVRRTVGPISDDSVIEKIVAKTVTHLSAEQASPERVEEALLGWNSEDIPGWPRIEQDDRMKAALLAAGPVVVVRDSEERLPDCTRCGHPPGWHRLSSDAAIQDPTDDRARFRCLGYDCDGPVPAGGRACECPNYERWRRP